MNCRHRFLDDPWDVKLAAEKQTVAIPGTKLRHLKQHFLYFRPRPHGHGSFRPTLT